MGDEAQRTAVGVVSFEELPMARDRTPAYQIVRSAGPVARDSNGGYVVISRQGAEYVLKHPELFSSKRAFDGVGSPVPMVPIASDPPEHGRYRRILQPFFSPRSTAPLLAEVRGLADELIDGFIGRGECDVVAEFAIPLPAQVFLALFGFPLADRDRLISWKDAILDTVGIRGAEAPSADSAKLGAQLYAYLVGHIAERRQQGGGNDLLGRLIADTSEDRLTDDELLGLSFQFVLAGLDTVTCALSTAFAALAVEPGLRRQIATDPAVIPDAVEELLRVDGPTVTLPRVATRDVELNGGVIPAGARVQVAVAAANRDPAEHADPDTIELRRQERHLAFGGGPHRCLGSHLARMGIEDRGLGIKPDQLAGFNQQLANPPEFDVAGSDQLGLFVVSQLASRHGIKVSLRESPYGGTTAIVLMPHGIVVPEGHPTTQGDGELAAAFGQAGGIAPTAGDPGLTGRHRLFLDPQDQPHVQQSAGVQMLPPQTQRPVSAIAAGRPPSGPATVPVQRYDTPHAAGTHLGLPRRVRQANLAPQLRDGPQRATGSAPPDADAARSPEDARAMMAALQHGWRRGRGDTRPPEGGRGGPADPQAASGEGEVL